MPRARLERLGAKLFVPSATQTSEARHLKNCVVLVFCSSPDFSVEEYVPKFFAKMRVFVCSAEYQHTVVTGKCDVTEQICAEL